MGQYWSRVYVINDDMKKMLKLGLLLSLLLAAIVVHAADFQAVAPSGQTIYYKIVQGGVEVTFPLNTSIPTYGWNDYTKPTGALVIPDSVTYGGVTYAVKAISNHAFYECIGLTSVTIPEGVTALRAQAFRGCTGMTSISLPSSLDSLYGYSLAYCSALTEVTIASATPPVCLANVFSNTTLSAATLHVPCSSMSLWNTAAPWNQFGSIVEDPCSATISVGANYASRGSVSGSGTYPYGTNVMLTATPFDGFFFACWSDGDTLNPRLIAAVEDCSLTALFFVLMHDTVYVTVYDTVTEIVHDTITPTLFHLTVVADGGGIGIGNALLPAGTMAEIGALPLEGNRFLQWNDGSTDNPRNITVTDNMTYTAVFETVEVGTIDAVQLWTVATEGHDIVASGVQGRAIRLFSADGRQLYGGIANSDAMRFRCAAAGVYLLSIDGGAARKIVITEH